MQRMFTSALVFITFFLLSAGRGHAQTGSSIAGVVKDTSGAVMPGVTVEASSAALIEKSRTAVTDGEGQYKIVGLVPGTYTVTFTLSGFNTVRREGIQLTAAFTANVNADMRVGELSETITVSGQAPTVDVQNVVQEQVMTRDVINAIPVGTKAVAAIGVLIPGVTSQAQDVGGSAFSATAISIHASRFNEQQLLYDGVYYNHGAGSGGNFNTIVPNDATIQEVSLETSGLSAESPNGGLRTNIIPKDGGNAFKGTFFGAYTNHHLQSTNLDDSLKALGLVSVPQVTEIYDVDPAFGGPLIKDRIWFFGSIRKQNSQQTVAGMYYNLTPTDHVYTPDYSRQAQNNEQNGNQSLRLTMQLNAKNKLNVQAQNGQQIRPYYGYACCNAFTSSPEANFYSESRPMYLVQASWSAPLTSKLLIEASAGAASKDYATYLQPGMNPLQPSWSDLSTGITWGNYGGLYGLNANFNFNGRVAASYVTGSHAAKFGVTFMHTWSHVTDDVSNNATTYQLLNGVPSRITVYSTPLELNAVMRANIGVFGQDQWTIRRLTLNMGLRFDYLNAYVPANSVLPGPNVPTRNVQFPEIDNVPDWKNISPRLGISYDLFGNNKTALKASIGRYMEALNLTTITRVADPTAAIVQSATRTWNDINHDFIPEPNELGGLSNSAFGTSVPNQAYGGNVMNDGRGYNWEITTTVDHEIVPRVSLSAEYIHRWFRNQLVTQNSKVTNASFSPYCITEPADPRLPGSGSQVCGLYDVVPAQFGQNFSIIQQSSVFGDQQDVFDGVDITTKARLPKNIILQGGVSEGRERSNVCFASNDLSLTSFAFPAALPAWSVGTPRTNAYCDVRPPFQANVKAIVVYPLPWWGLETSATYQGLPGPMILANATYTNAQIAPSLGRNLSSGANGTVSISLIPPGTVFGDRLNQVDYRVAKTFKFGESRRIQGIIDIYNLLNGSAVITQNNTYGSAWLRPTQILQARLFKFGLQIEF